MLLENLVYTGVQLAHNFGAVAVVASAAAAVWLVPGNVSLQRKLAKLMATGWVVQGASGALFGAVSYGFYGKFPDIKGIAVAALVVKVVCAVAGFVVVLGYLEKVGAWSTGQRQAAWRVLSVLAFIPLIAAAFLRWFS
ncbi:MAG: hypothetical protein C4528_03855 [Gammaproteobacteria bacterium]|nr:MAG: hypothetical protein C4528_03855 [Gammaproteobacteria bacterium]